MQRITVNLAPADIRKEGSAFDLAIALGILITSKQIELDGSDHCLIIGELALDGSLRPVPGVLSMVHAAKLNGLKKVILPQENYREAMLIEGIQVIPLRHLQDINVINNTCDELNEIENISEQSVAHDDYSDVIGQNHVKRAVTIAAAGMHNIVLVGPPGTGKTMLIRRLPTILPTMSDDEALEVTKIYSAAGKLPNRANFIRNRPFRSPHHTVSQGGLVGGGSNPKPGEISLAHRGVLFLDELPEFSRATLEVLRQPMEDRFVTIGRARAVYTFPAHFILAASMNPCPCGYLGSDSPTNSCTCSSIKIMQYRAKISGPLLDRIDLHVEVPRLEYASLANHNKENTSSASMKLSVEKAVEIQAERYRTTNIQFNGELTGRLLRKYCQLNKEAEQLLLKSFDALGLSVRAHDKILKIARTIADLDGNDAIHIPHVAEAIQYRGLDRNEK